jgi:enoyl-CoA hydratase/carnithine racemase
VVRDLTSAASFSSASPAERAAVLLGTNGPQTRSVAGSLLISEALIDGRPARVALTDRTQAGGAFGVEESAALQAVMERSIADRVAVALVLDSAGARLDQGLPALAAFRCLFAAALKARLAGVPMIAIVARDCFGGASMLAALCGRRLAMGNARFGLSGPGIIEVLAGKVELDASDRRSVAALFGAQARLSIGVFDEICADDSQTLRDAFAAALTASALPRLDLRANHDRLRRRLVDAHVAVSNAREPWRGFVNGAAVTARDCWLAAESLLATAVPSDLDISLDSPGQAATRLDESLGLSEYAVHLALCLMRRAAEGGRIRLTITGEAAGAIYVALSAPAVRVFARHAAAVRLLPPGAVARVLGAALPDAQLALALRSGVVDEVLAE